MATPRKHRSIPTSDALDTSVHEGASPSSSQESELATLRQELGRLRAEVAALRAVVAPPMTDLSGVSLESVAGDTEREAPGELTSRRTLLKWGGLGAAAALAAAGGASLTSQTAHAADGANLVLGQANTAEHTTTLTYDGTETTPLVLLADASAIAQSTGLSGHGGSGGVGVTGSAAGGTSSGLAGASDSGYGVQATSSTGIALFANGTGRIQQQLSGFFGAPTSGTYNIGEQIRDENGNLFICIAGGTPGIWKKVLAMGSGIKGGGTAYLTSPIRIYDSRTTSSLPGNGARGVQITGVTISGQQVPSGALGCFGNLTVTNTAANGYLVIYPQFSPTPSTSTVNFLAGQTSANSFSVALSNGGAVTVHSFSSGKCNFIIDIAGFVA